MEEMTIEEATTRLRARLLEIERAVRSLGDHPHLKAVTGKAQAYPGQHGEMIAQSKLALRAVEDARMRLGKVLQYGRDGVSIYDRTEAP